MEQGQELFGSLRFEGPRVLTWPLPNWEPEQATIQILLFPRFHFEVARPSPQSLSKDREVDVIVNVNILYSDPQARRIPANVTYGELEIEHHLHNLRFA